MQGQSGIVGYILFHLLYASNIPIKIFLNFVSDFLFGTYRVAQNKQNGEFLCFCFII